MNKQQATSNKQQATSNKQQATSNKQQATSNKQQATSNKQQTAKYIVFLAIVLLLQLVSLNMTGQQINYQQLHNPTTIDSPPNFAHQVGATTGSDKTSTSGSSHYSIELEMPKSTNDMVPNINLEYSSNDKNGSLGLGWYLSGLSSISRTKLNFYNDTKCKAVDFTNNDGFLLDGYRLIPTSGNNGNPNTVYATENETFSKIESFGTSGTGPNYFVLTTKQGNTIEYGNTMDSKVTEESGNTIAIWRINKIRDVNGNYIQFKYINTDRDYRIDEILFTGNDVTGLLPYNKIKFDYKIRDDKNTYFEAGSSFVNKNLLETITITGEGGVQFKKYALSYGKEKLYSLLHEIQESGSDNSTLNSTRFMYGSEDKDIEKTTTGFIAGQEIDIFPADFDGDGYTDLLSLHRNIAQGSNLVFYDQMDIWKRSATSNNYTVAFTQQLSTTFKYPKNNVEIPDQQSYMNADYDGDGDDDILIANIDNLGNSPLLTNLTVYYSSNSATTFTPTIYPPPTYNGLSYQNFSTVSGIGRSFHTGDFDGDGGMDIICMLGNSQAKAFLTSFAQNEINKPIHGLAFTDLNHNPMWCPDVLNADKLLVIDFDGDGKHEIMTVEQGTTRVFSIVKEFNPVYNTYYKAEIIYQSGYPTEWHSIMAGDFNGDGKTDFLTRTNNANLEWNIAYSTGTSLKVSNFSFQHQPFVNQAPNYVPNAAQDHHLVIADFNGDGKSDILHELAVNHTGGNLLYDVYYAKGTNGSTNASDDFEYQYYYSNTGFNMARHLVGDFNADGQADFIDRGIFTAPLDIVYLEPNNKNRLLQKVVNGMGYKTEYNYQLLTTEGTFYTKGTQTPFPITTIQAPTYVIQSVKTSNGLGGLFEKSFSYNGLKLHRSGKGMLGFSKVSVSDNSDNIKTEVINNTNLQYCFNYTSSIKNYNLSTGTLIAETNNSIGIQNLGGVRHFVKNEVTEAINVLGNSTTKTTNTYDNYGNVTNTSTSIGNTEVTSINRIYGAFANPIPNRVISETSTKTRTGETPISMQTTYSYDVKGRKTQEKIFSNLPNWVATNFTYDNYGNVISKINSGGNVGQTPTTQYGYDTKGCNVLSTTNPLNQTEFFEYTNTAIFGLPSKKTGIDGKITLMEYDGFGAIKKITQVAPYSAADIVTQTTLHWDITPPSVFYTHTTQNGSPDTRVWSDVLGRETKKQMQAFNGQWNTALTSYDANGKTATTTQPFLPSEVPLTTAFSYDSYGRVNQIVSPYGTTQKSYGYQIYQGNNYFKETTTAPNGNIKIVYTDEAGKVFAHYENGYDIRNFYNSWGSIRETKAGSSNVLSTHTYDSYGRKTQTIDADAGTISYYYNAFSQLVQQTDANNYTTTFSYNLLGEITNRTGAEGTTSYTYATNGPAINKILSINGFAGLNNSEYFTYNSKGLLQNHAVNANGQMITRSYTYDLFGNIENYTNDLNNQTLHYVRNTRGYLSEILNNTTGSTLYRLNSKNGLNKALNYELGNGLISDNIYTNGLLTRKQTTGIQDYEISYDPVSYNIAQRRDHLYGLTEDFGYDVFNRLTDYDASGVGHRTISYAPNGNISLKDDKDGNAYTYFYHPTKKNAVEKIANTSNVPTSTFNPPPDISSDNQTIEYTPFNRVQGISEGDFGYEVEYGAGYQRNKSILYYNGTPLTTRYYFGDLELTIDQNGINTSIQYIKDENDNNIAMMVAYNGAIPDEYYTYTDHIGSILTVTDASGTKVAEQSFDAWGRHRDPSSWAYVSQPSLPHWLYRGYTSHEHLPAFNLINMNGRLYDPVKARMLSPDRFIQDPSNTQNYNRYSYAYNNPLSFNDPSGEIIITQGLVFAMAMATSVGSFTGMIIADNNSVSTLKGAVVGGLVGLATFGFGNIISGATSSIWWASTLSNAALYSISAGVLQVALGGSSENVATSMKWGAILGGLSGFISSEQFINYLDGYGFQNNNDIYKYFERIGCRQCNIDFFSKRLGREVYSYNMRYDPSLNDYGLTSKTGEVTIGPSAFKSSKHLKATIIHEYYHRKYDLVLDIHGNFVKWNYGRTQKFPDDDGVIGYLGEIEYAGKLGLDQDFFNIKWKITPADAINDYINPLYHTNLIKAKWFYLIPQRF